MKHPAEIISFEEAGIIRSFAAEAERAGTLHPEQLKLIYENKWFNLYVPAKYGGLELTLTQGLEIEEALAYIDGSTGWTVTLCSGANWFIGFLSPGAAEDIFNSQDVCLAGSGKPSGVAKITDNGYEITGYWKYATGAPHATVFTANCTLEKEGNILYDEEGNPRIASFWFKKEEVTIDNNWHSAGMIATASESFYVNQLTVSFNRRFHIDSKAAVLTSAIYQYPFLQFAEATLAVNFSGMAMRFLDLCESLFASIEKNKYRDETSMKILANKLLNSKLALNECRENVYTSINESWKALQQDKNIHTSLLQQVSTSCRELALKSRKLVEDMYPFCGLAAADPSTEINRVWRNMHTATQHSLLNYPL